MRRITISVDDALADTFDRMVKARGYENRSEAFRDLLRTELERERLRPSRTDHCVGALSYVYNHHERQLPRLLNAMQHDHHDLTVSSMHAHLDHDNCIETVILRGPTQAVLDFAEAVIAQKGVRHGRFYPIPVEASPSDHGIRSNSHTHHRPHT